MWKSDYWIVEFCIILFNSHETFPGLTKHNVGVLGVVAVVAVSTTPTASILGTTPEQMQSAISCHNFGK